jgi:hypothetical protein
MTEQIQLSICVDYKSESKAVKSLIDLISYQTNLGCQDAKIMTSSDPMAKTADFFIGKIAVSNLIGLKKNVFLTDIPYSYEPGEFLLWKNNLDRIHQSLCNTGKIIVTNDDVKNSMLLKHSQDVFKVDTPVTFDIFQRHNSRKKEGLCVVISQNYTIPASLINLFKKHKISYEILRFSSGQVIDAKDLLKITDFAEIFWLDDLDLRYSNEILNPIALSLSGVKVIVNDLSLTGTLNGMNVSEWISQRGRGVNIYSMAKQMAKEYLSLPSYSITAFLKTHLE